MGQLVEARWHLNNYEPNRTGEDSLDAGSSRPGIFLLLAFERIFIVLIRSNNSHRGEVWGGFRQVSHFYAFARTFKPPRTQNAISVTGEPSGSAFAECPVRCLVRSHFRAIMRTAFTGVQCGSCNGRDSSASGTLVAGGRLGTSLFDL